MKPLFGFLLLLACFALVSPASAQRGNRIALLIGNANYPDANPPPPTPIKDARALADELRRSDFEVDVKENVGKDDMQRAIDAFYAKIRPGGVALFFFSGFGIQSGRQTFMIPVESSSAPETGSSPQAGKRARQGFSGTSKANRICRKSLLALGTGAYVDYDGIGAINGAGVFQTGSERRHQPRWG